MSRDAINPPHYRSHPSGIEAIEITEHFNFCLGNAVKYIWRAGMKDDAVQDLEKARWYLDREITRRRGHTLQLIRVCPRCGGLADAEAHVCG